MTSTQARNRPGPFGLGTGSSSNEQSRTSNKGFGSGFGTGSGAWNGGIWSGTAIGSGLKSSVQENNRAQNDIHNLSNESEAITGSKSLLSSSESDGYNLRRHGSWASVEETSPHLSRVHTNHSGTSPVRRQHSNQLVPQALVDSNSASSTYFSTTPAATTISSRSSQKNFLDPTSGDFVASGPFEPNNIARSSRHNSDEENRYNARRLAFEGNDAGLTMQVGRPPLNNNVSGYNSSAASRSGSLPPSRSDGGHGSRHPGDTTSMQHSRFPTSTNSSYRPNLSAHAQPYIMPSTGSQGQTFAEQLTPMQMNKLLGDVGNLNIGKDTSIPTYAGSRDQSYGSSPHFINGYPQENLGNTNEVWNREDNTTQAQQPSFSPTDSGTWSLISNPNNLRGVPYGGHYSHSPSNSDARLSHPSPYYSTAGTPPTYQRAPSRTGYNGGVSTGQAALLERRLRGLQQEQQDYLIPAQNQMPFRNQFPQSNTYDFHPQHTLRPNTLNSYYPIPPAPNVLPPTQIPRGPARDHDLAQPVRSPLLEEFRNNSKTNKRYELKDIYNYIVEFSGDQHGSRFIQQKLETANSDEKDQVFRELYPNAIQLMTDVFGNYVIQKFFEHGNQSQKKVLANQMRSHILTLSTQMYGCRVVQKALEHILTDQQAQLIKELENNVLKCVKDQNGNHVVQKAIERVPAEHIQFIINSFTGQVQSLATHPYGCRVIQRMLEHCEEPTRSAVLQELHACAPALIVDQYGNYVTQHVIEHGRDEDRSRIIGLVTNQLSNFSKHKFASNVVEKSIQFGSKQERHKIVATLTAVNDKGESPSQSLIRDQYGNYVIQKLLNELKGTERDEFVELIKAQLALLKRFSYGKQIAAIEKLIYTTPFLPPQLQNGPLLPIAIDTSAAPTPPLSTGAAQSPQSSSLPSPHRSSVDDPDGSRKSSGSNAVSVMTPTST